MLPILSDLSIAAGLLLLLFIGLEFGFRSGRRAVEERDSKAAGQIGAIQGAVLGLLGLLLGFSFAAAGARFLERQDLIVQEANSIGTTYLRAGLLAEPYRSELRSELKRYTAERLVMSQQLRGGFTQEMADKVTDSHTKIWNIAKHGVLEERTLVQAVLPPVNELIDLHSTRVGAARKHLPKLVMGLLIACSALSVVVIGYGCGLSDSRRLPMTIPLAVVIATSLWITIDLDHPRAGLLLLNDAPLREISFPED